MGRLVTDLLEHLRHLLLVQHLGEVPDWVPVTDETRDRLRAQANQIGEPTVLRLCDLLAIAVDDMRQGGDPRLPLELALVKVTRAGADLSQESLAFRLERLEKRGGPPPHKEEPGTVTATVPSPISALAEENDAEATEEAADDVLAPPALELQQLQEAWARSVLAAVEERSIPTASMYREAHPVALEEDRLTIEFPGEASSTASSPRPEERRHPPRRALRRDRAEARGVVHARREIRSGRGRGEVARRERARRAAQGDVRRERGGRRAMSMDMNKLMKQAQQMQEQMAKAQAELGNEIVEATAGGGLVTVKATGAGDLVSISIDPKAIDPDDVELLEDLVLAAVNEALRSAQALAQSKLGAMTGGLGLPGF